MVTITDTEGILDLSLLEVYFLCDENSIIHQKHVVDRLNEEKFWHNGLFHFNVIVRGEVPYKGLPKDLLKEINRHNVFIHLVNGIHHYFNYGLGAIDMTEDYESVQNEVKGFIRDVCSFNIRSLDMLKDRPTDSAIADSRDYANKGLVRRVFKDVLQNKKLFKFH